MSTDNIQAEQAIADVKPAASPKGLDPIQTAVGQCKWFFARFKGGARYVLAVDKEAAERIAAVAFRPLRLMSIGTPKVCLQPGNPYAAQIPPIQITETTPAKDVALAELIAPFNYEIKTLG